MLSNEVLSVRLGGIYALQRLFEEDPDQYYLQIMDLFCAFIRFPTKPKNAEGQLNSNPYGWTLEPREDIDPIVDIISRLRKNGLQSGVGARLAALKSLIPALFGSQEVPAPL